MMVLVFSVSHGSKCDGFSWLMVKERESYSGWTGFPGNRAGIRCSQDQHRRRVLDQRQLRVP